MGNQMTAELLVKFNALQLQADTVVNKNIKDRNRVVDADKEEEIQIFQDLVTEQYNAGKINDDDYLTLMNVDFSQTMVSNPGKAVVADAEGANTEGTGAESTGAGNTNTESTGIEGASVIDASTTTVVKTKEQKKAEKDDTKRRENRLKDDIQQYLNGISVTPSATPNLLDGLIEKLEGLYPNDSALVTQRDEAIALVNHVQRLINNGEINSKEDIEDLFKDIKRSNIELKDSEGKTIPISDFQKSLAGQLKGLVVKEQIAKEANVLVGYYNYAKNILGEHSNYTEYLESVDEQINENSQKDKLYYSKEAYELLKQVVAKEVESMANSYQSQLNYDTDFTGDNKVTVKDIKNVLKTKFPDDTFAHEVIDKMNITTDVTASNMNADRRRNELKTITRNEAIKGLGQDLFTKLEDKFFKGNGPYDLTSVSDAIRLAIGADCKLNTYEDYKMSETYEALNNLNELVNRGDLNEEELKKLMKFCNIKEENRNRNIRDAFLGEWVEASSEGAIVGAALALINTDQLVVKKEMFLNVLVNQTVITWPAAVAGPAAGFVLRGLLNLAFGMKNNEKTCFRYDEAKDKTFEEYAEYIKRNEKNEEKAKAIIAIARIYSDKYNENWNTEFVNDMNTLAGNPILNCKEFSGGVDKLVEKLLKETEEATDVTENHVTSEPEEKTETIVTTKSVTHDWKSGQSWQAIVLAYYPEAFDGLSKKEIDKKIKKYIDAFRREHGINFRQGLPVGKRIAFKPITVDGVTYNPVQADENRVKDCTSDTWYGYGNNYFTNNWNIPTQGNASPNGNIVYTATRQSDNKSASDVIERNAQQGVMPEAQENVEITVTINNADGTSRTEVIEAKK